MTKLEQLYKDWIDSELALDLQRQDIIESLRKKISEIHNQRMEARKRIADGKKKFDEFNKIT